MSLRLVGIFFVVDGISGAIGNGVDLLDQFRHLRQYPDQSVNTSTVAWLLSSVFLVAAGLYLVRCGPIAYEALMGERRKQEPLESDDESGT
jgi:hypothetical protein